MLRVQKIQELKIRKFRNGEEVPGWLETLKRQNTRLEIRLTNDGKKYEGKKPEPGPDMVLSGKQSGFRKKNGKGKCTQQ